MQVTRPKSGQVHVRQPHKNPGPRLEETAEPEPEPIAIRRRGVAAIDVAAISRIGGYGAPHGRVEIGRGVGHAGPELSVELSLRPVFFGEPLDDRLAALIESLPGLLQ